MTKKSIKSSSGPEIFRLLSTCKICSTHFSTETTQNCHSVTASSSRGGPLGDRKDQKSSREEELCNSLHVGPVMLSIHPGPNSGTKPG